jgi:hypothetical protein
VARLSSPGGELLSVPRYLVYSDSETFCPETCSSRFGGDKQWRIMICIVMERAFARAQSAADRRMMLVLMLMLMLLAVTLGSLHPSWSVCH